jgi:hypothetical protein
MVIGPSVQAGACTYIVFGSVLEPRIDDAPLGVLIDLSSAITRSFPAHSELVAIPIAITTPGRGMGGG